MLLSVLPDLHLHLILHALNITEAGRKYTNLKLLFPQKIRQVQR